MAEKIEIVDDEALSPKKETFFKADSALIRELGERLVGHPHIALAELIKNAYDADATLCIVELNDDEIVVTDNGHGIVLSLYGYKGLEELAGVLFSKANRPLKEAINKIKGLGVKSEAEISA